MLDKITKESIFHHWQTPTMLLVFFSIRASSFFLTGHLITQSVLAFLIILLLGILYFKNPDWAFYLVIGEIFLGGGGHYLEFLGLSIRTLLIGTFLILWTLHTVSQGIIREHVHLEKHLSIFLIVFYFLLVISVINGLYHGHPMGVIIQDLMPFLYLPLIFPAFHLLSRESAQEYFTRLIIAFIIGSAIFSVFTFVLFSTGIAELQEPFYKWFRDVSLGKITNMGNNFFRIVLPEHLLMTPIVLIISSLLMRDEKHHKMWRILLFLSTMILVLNFSRVYLLALVAGLVILKYKHRWKRWLIVSATTLGLFFLIFASFSILASGGKSLGEELFGTRVASLATPDIEASSANRMMMLPSIFEIIKSAPILGVGLGASVTFLNTKTYELVTSRQFDWGYLEMMAELGTLRTLALLALIFFGAWKLMEKIKHAPDWHDFYVGLLGGIMAMLVTNLTSPALFHVFGIIFFVLILAIAIKPMDIFEKLITLLYRIFNRVKSV